LPVEYQFSERAVARTRQEKTGQDKCGFRLLFLLPVLYQFAKMSKLREWKSALQSAGASSLTRSQPSSADMSMKELIWRRKNINEYSSNGKGPKKLQRQLREEYDLNKPGIHLPPAFSAGYHAATPNRSNAAGGSHPQLAVGGETNWGNPQGASHDYSYQTGGMSEELKRQFLLHGGRKRRHADQRYVNSDTLGTNKAYSNPQKWMSVSKLVHSPQHSAASPAPRLYNPSMSQSTGFRL
jgi:hypothetical protein